MLPNGPGEDAIYRAGTACVRSFQRCFASHPSRGRAEGRLSAQRSLTFVSKVAFLRTVALAMILTCAAWRPARAGEAATQHASCARSTFRVLIDVGHTATSPGADSARGVPEYQFNLRLADVIVQSLLEAGFDKTVRLITKGAKLPSLFERATRANNAHADLFIAIHHDSVPDNLTEAWQYEGKKNYYSDRFSGYAIFVSNDNVDRAGSLAFGHSLGQELQKRGLHYTSHYTFALMGRYRHELGRVLINRFGRRPLAMSAIPRFAESTRTSLEVRNGPGADLNCGAAKKAPDYSITSSAVASSVFGTYRAETTIAACRGPLGSPPWYP
jgi:N-acetylmuramoyl-L-alanine amidase